MKLYLGLLATLLLTYSCTMAPRKKPPVKAAPATVSEFEKVEAKLQADQTEEAIDILESIVSSHPQSDLADDAYIMVGEIYYNQPDYEKAYESFMGVVNSDVFSPREAFALLWASRSLHRLGRFDEALSLTNRILRIRGLSKESRTATYKLRFTILSQLGDRIDALKALIYLAENDDDKNIRETSRNKALDFVRSRLNIEELEMVANDSSFDFVRGYAAFRLSTIYFEQRDFWRAREFSKQTIRHLPDSDLSEQAQHRINQIDARRKVEPKTIGAVLPLSGRYSHIAYKTLRGIQLGLGIYGPNSSGFRLAVVDSEGNADAARRAVERLVTEDHVVAIIGSLMSKTSVAVASKADELGVPTIGLSQKSGLTEVGDYVFRNALTSRMQVQQLVSMAMDQMGYRRFAILHPNDPYGVEYANLFWDEVLARGGEIRSAQAYEAGETDFNDQIQRLVGTYFIEDRQDEYKLRLEEWIKDRKILSARVSPPDDLLPPVIDFEAIFIPDSIKAIGQIAPMLAYNDVTEVRLLGTNLWNTPSFLKRGQRYVENALFVDSILSSDPSFLKTTFYKEFEKVFGEKPGIFEAQAYDAALILRQLIAEGVRSRRGLAEELVRLTQFPGSVGGLNMNQNREILRPLVGLTVFQGKIEPYDPTRHKKAENEIQNKVDKKQKNKRKKK